VAPSDPIGSVKLSTTLGLLREMKKGNRVALNALVERYYPKVLRIATLRLGTRLRGVAEIEDVVQEAWIVALRSFDRFEPRSEGALISWLATVLENCIRDLKRKAKAQKRGLGRVQLMGDLTPTSSTGGTGLAAPGPQPSEVARAHEIEEIRDDALLRLPPRHREMIILRDDLHLSFEEIAEEMKFRKVVTARSLHFTASHRLRAMLERLERNSTRGSKPHR